MMRRAAFATILAVILPLAGCDQSLGPSDRLLAIEPSGPITFEAVGDSVRLTITVRTDGRILGVVPVAFRSTDPAIVSVRSDGVIHSEGPGTAWVVVRERFGAADSVAVTVRQVADSLEVFWTDTSSILSVGLGASLPLTCGALDRNGFEVSPAPRVSSAQGTVSGSDCANLAALRSGFDTLTITSGAETTQLSLALAILPLPGSTTGQFITLDSFPFNLRLWAPSARVNSQGDIEVYVTGYESVPDSNGVGPGALHRLVSSDGESFRYDGIAVDLPAPPCGLICTGIENIAVIHRNDSPGWRMLLAAGSSGTYGWQVFSAVSPDERTWAIEPGVRISNGGVVPPAPPQTPPWPVGEGMVIDQLPGGEWRMLVGGYEPVPGSADKFQIVEYQSPDQMTWTYQGVRFTTDQLPATGQRSVYSPTLVEFVPGLWRMFVTADDLNLVGGRSRIFSAVSTDRVAWQFETELLGGVGTNLYYSALVNDRLYFLRQDAGELRQVAFVTLAMP